MKIQEYSFGKMNIDGKIYAEDLIIFPDKIKDNWWRKEGHLLQLNDLNEVWNNCKKLIIGKGYDGMMEISNDVKKKCKELRIKLVFGKTKEMVKEYNNSDKEKTIAGFHLTC